ncbi:MAG: hypothetical protein V7L23_18685 [Nostoc sp.]|uniref:hypothetical protein n=1 Tax=Nostoc sp. TaxID=1180 RepID=UPI002FF214C4
MQVNQYPNITAISSADLLLVQTSSDGAYKNIKGSDAINSITSNVTANITALQNTEATHTSQISSLQSSSIQLPSTIKASVASTDYFIGIDSNGNLYKITYANLTAGLSSGNSPTPISYAQVGDVKSFGTNGGSYGSAVDITRTLNTVITSASWLSLNTSTSVITLAAGTYLVDGYCTAGSLGSFKGWLADASTNAVLLLGSSAYPNTSYYAACLSMLQGQIVLSASTTLVLKMRATNTNTNTSALGVATGADTGQTELYSCIGFTKIA